MKPELFIGSSSEQLLLAYALQDQLKGSANVTIWNQGFFKLNTSFLESLVTGLSDSDFGVFVFAPDDLVNLRGDALAAVRDNVLFELGLAMGRLGKDRVFFVMPDGKGDLRLPSDLIGLSSVTFDAARTPIEAAVGPATFRILQAIKKFGVRQDRLTPPSIEIIKNPKVLCVCSEQYYHLSFQRDVDLIKQETAKIGAEITELRGVTTHALTQVLMESQFDLIHLCCYVDAKTGTIYLSDVTADGNANSPVDSMTAPSFAKLVELAKAKLVILATCDSLILAAKLARVSNMVASTDMVSVDEILKWELGLYKCLSKGISLSNAYETASTISNAPMLLLLKKDIAFIG